MQKFCHNPKCHYHINIPDYIKNTIDMEIIGTLDIKMIKRFQYIEWNNEGEERLKYFCESCVYMLEYKNYNRIREVE